MAYLCSKILCQQILRTYVTQIGSTKSIKNQLMKWVSIILKEIVTEYIEMYFEMLVKINNQT